MTQLSYHVVFDTKDGTVSVAGTDTLPVDSAEWAWDSEDEEWRRPTDDERTLADEVERQMADALRDVNAGATAYEVSWSIEVEADSPRDAADQAWAILIDAANGVGVATMLVVRRAVEKKSVFDMGKEV